jgi:hypothetical protein
MPVIIRKTPVVGAILIIHIELQAERFGNVVLQIYAQIKIGHVMIKREHQGQVSILDITAIECLMLRPGPK